MVDWVGWVFWSIATRQRATFIMEVKETTSHGIVMEVLYGMMMDEETQTNLAVF